MDALIPPGYRAVMIGAAESVEDLNAFVPMEESSAEGSLFIMRLDFSRFPTAAELSELEQRLQRAGVHPFPGYPFIVYADTTQPSVYLAWQKGFAWLPVIAGILALTVLPPLLGSLIWLILPQSFKDLINSLIGMGMMLSLI
ncbi:MAG: hypothetical protein N2506_04995, partial [Dehalococcoidales bacterium]|nr:hypothetical protein [Dehalococcoidales bacterium]